MAWDRGSGFHGKVPTRGDFVARRLPRDFLEPWDAWLQKAIATSREQLKDAWLEFYLVSPMWRFGTADGVCGPRPWIGVLMPSVDQVGRYFPLTVAAPLPAGSNLVQLVANERQWFERVEALLLTAVEDENFDVDRFDRALEVLDPPAVRTVVQTSAMCRREPATPVHISLNEAENVSQAFLELTHRLASGHLGPYSLWWSQHSDRIPSSLLLCRGLPPARSFAALLDGQWQHWDWES